MIIPNGWTFKASGTETSGMLAAEIIKKLI
jgi:hypothetical protein